MQYSNTLRTLSFFRGSWGAVEYEEENPTHQSPVEYTQIWKDSHNAPLMAWRAEDGTYARMTPKEQAQRSREHYKKEGLELLNPKKSGGQKPV